MHSNRLKSIAVGDVFLIVMRSLNSFFASEKEIVNGVVPFFLIANLPCFRINLPIIGNMQQFSGEDKIVSGVNARNGQICTLRLYSLVSLTSS